MEVDVPPLRHDQFALLARPRVSRLLATLGIVLITIGLYVPVAGRDVVMQSGPLLPASQTWAFENTVAAPLGPFHLGHLALRLQLGLLALFSALILGGLALIPLLWRTLSPNGTVVLRRISAAWLVLVFGLAVASLPAWWQFMSQPPPGPPVTTTTLAASYLLPGAIIFPLGVLVTGTGLLLRFREPLPTSVPALALRTGWWWIATFLLTAGALVWGIGFYLMPVVTTAACPPVIFSVTQFARGACAGLDSDQVLHVAYDAGLGPIPTLVFIVGSNFAFLVAAGCITTLGGWTRQLSVATLAWLSAWPVVALCVAFVALHGVGEVAQQGFQLTAVTGAGWHVAAGMVVTFVGIGLVVLGQIGLWRELVRRKRSAYAP